MDFSDIRIHITKYDVMPWRHRMNILQAFVAGGGLRRAGKTRGAVALFAELL